MRKNDILTFYDGSLIINKLGEEWVSVRPIDLTGDLGIEMSIDDLIDFRDYLNDFINTHGFSRDND